MGRFSDGLFHRMRVRRGTRAMRHPPGVGAVMYCATCKAELLRCTPGVGMSGPAQQAAFDAHQRVCKLRHLDREASAAAATRNEHREWIGHRARRWRWRLLWIAVGAGALGLAAWLALR